MDPALSIAPLAGDECPAAARLLARAFRDNPLNVAVIGESDPQRRLRSNTHGMRALLPTGRLHGRVVTARLGGRLAGALVATPPQGYPLPAAPGLVQLRCLLGQGWRVARRWNEVFRRLAPLHPSEPHAYLGTLGVEPGLQGRGVGSTLLRHWLEHGEPARHPAYLETDAPANVAFYARAGFSVEGELSIFGARIWRMRRPAAG